ncbi:MAG TPA: DUF1775 domain-containing protein [Solirubrobacteraceae bacterium]|jgi:uncharacterized protein YcnI|nr:DUF1775 domain-containing protein [Solirubrobacteraceae bacterium]
MHRRRRRAAEVVTAAVAFGALAAPGAVAHVTVQPATSRPAELQRYRVIVPNERDSGATIGVELKVPAGVTFALVESVAGWRTKVVQQAGAITRLRWSAGHVAPGAYAELHFIVRNPVRVGPIAWKALQRYDNGDVVRWIGSADSEQPAPITTLGEDAVPVDVVSTHGEAAPAPSSSAAAPAEHGERGRDGLTFALAILAAVLGAAALALQVGRRRPRA